LKIANNSRIKVNNTVFMDVVITSDIHAVPINAKLETSSELSKILEELKQQNLVSINMSKGEFVIECMSRGLNDYRKDLVVYDC
tara:strand:+ start:373 stop:624 length:252 start_codon:yes stop_codon:yes gene_type:complete